MIDGKLPSISSLLDGLSREREHQEHLENFAAEEVEEELAMTMEAV